MTIPIVSLIHAHSAPPALGGLKASGTHLHTPNRRTMKPQWLVVSSRPSCTLCWSFSVPFISIHWFYYDLSVFDLLSIFPLYQWSIEESELLKLNTTPCPHKYMKWLSIYIFLQFFIFSNSNYNIEAHLLQGIEVGGLPVMFTLTGLVDANGSWECHWFLCLLTTPFYRILWTHFCELVKIGLCMFG